jgi:hypothetical protein
MQQAKSSKLKTYSSTLTVAHMSLPSPLSQKDLDSKILISVKDNGPGISKR